MKPVHTTALLLSAITVAVPAHGQRATQAFPAKPIRMVTSEVGGSQDVVARILAQGLTPQLGQQLIVDNRPSGVIPGEIVAYSVAARRLLP